MLIIAGNESLNAQRGMRGSTDTTRMNRPHWGIDSAGMNRMSHFPEHNMRGFTGHRSEFGMRGGSRREPGFGMRNEFGMGPMGHEMMGRGRMIDNIPNLTDKQKKEIEDLRQARMDEMKKVREEALAKVKTIMESNRSKILNLLTEEQKKYFESETGSKETITPKSE